MKKLILFLALTLTAPADWKQWRGPQGAGHSDAKLPTQWSETKNVAWRTAIPGKGWSSPVIEGNQVWMTTAFEPSASGARYAQAAGRAALSCPRPKH